MKVSLYYNVTIILIALWYAYKNLKMPDKKGIFRMVNTNNQVSIIKPTGT